MYIRKLNKKGKLTRASAAKEWKVIHDLNHYYGCNHSNEVLSLRYHNQEIALSKVLMDYNSHLFEKLAAEYLAAYPEALPRME